MLANRLRNRFKHLSKWARRSAVTCFRIYDRDISDQPCIVDWYDGHAVVWCLDRKRDDTEEQAELWRCSVRKEVATGLDIPQARVYIKRRGRQRGREQYVRLGDEAVIRTVSEQGLSFEVNLSDYLDTGLFLDHRTTRAMVREQAAGKRVLNLFAYTGSFTCYAAAGGAASSLTVDMSRTYSDWTARNLALNQLTSEQHRIETVDCMRFLEQTPSERFDLIVCDPPTFSNSKRMDRSWSVDRDHPWLLWRLNDFLAPGGSIYFSTNSRSFELANAGLPPLRPEEVTHATVPEDFERKRPHRCWVLRK
ncbi:MAG: class I SAM-dependent methyltransferase [Planctomycetota bacterium]|jgi:23S rRNA (cytosine1962-C5)-methyltransferase|nr:class I SAM-dependent methyltransferase [Planctomycetota bacterium]